MAKKKSDKIDIISTVKNYFNYYIDSLNNNKIILGLAILFFNIASKYLAIEISDSEEALIKNLVTRELFIFILIFINTRDIILSIILTACFIILANTIFNTKSQFCMIPEKYRKLEKVLDSNKDGIVSEKEIENAKKILEKANQQNIKKYDFSY
jgi:hypothetical protein